MAGTATLRSLLAVVATAIAISSNAACSPVPPQPSPLSPEIPGDVAGLPTQDAFDTLSWQLFVALNWPTRNGQVDPSRTIGQAADTPRVWELYTDPIDIFQSSSLCPDEKSSEHTKLLRMARDNTGAVDGLDVQAGSLWPLIDQSRNFALVEVVVNDVHKSYITTNGLTTARGIETYVQNRSIRFPDGSMEVKAAWRLFPDAADPRILARYHTRKAVICVSKEQSRTGQPLKIEGTVGLVGLHIVYKTSRQPKWVWSTFEQVDNYEVTYKPLPGLEPTFSTGGDPIGANRQPQPAPAAGQLYQWSPTQPTASSSSPTQVARCPNEPALPSAVNTKWQAALAGIAAVPNSPWQYYRLNTTQWFDSNEHLQPRNTDGAAISRNSTLETYLLGDQTIAGQVPAIGPVISSPVVDPSNSTLADTIVATMVAASTPEKTGPYTWSSCVVCHQMAMYQYGPGGAQGGIMTDFSFVFRSNLPAGGIAPGSGVQSRDPVRTGREGIQ